MAEPAAASTRTPTIDREQDGSPGDRLPTPDGDPGRRRRSAIVVAALVALTALGLGILVGLALDGDDESPPPAAPGLADVMARPASLVGQRVSVAGEVREILSPRTFTLGRGTGGDEVVVSAPRNILAARIEAPLFEGDFVEVSGTVRVIQTGDAAEELDADLARDDLTERAGEALIVARNVDAVRFFPVYQRSPAEAVVQADTLAGAIVSVQGTVARIAPSGTLVLEEELPVIPRTALRSNPRRGDEVVVLGTLRRLDPDQISALRSGSADELLGDFADRPAILARAVHVLAG